MSLEATEEIQPRRRMNPRVIIVAVVLVIVGVVLVVSTIARGDVGVLKVDDAGVSKVLTDADTDVTARLPLTLLEGGDVVHESEHVFQSLAGQGGIGRVFLSIDGTTIEVDYDSSVTGEAQVVQALAAAGYTTPPGAPAQP